MMVKEWSRQRGVQQEERVFDKRRTQQNTKKENGKGIGVASCAVWLRDMDDEKRENKEIGRTGNVTLEKVGND